MGAGTTGLTAKLGSFIAGTDAERIPGEAFEHAKIAFLDWVAVTVAGKDDPLVTKLIDYAETMGGNAQATIIGHGARRSVSQAALINGSASHALDYDDTLASFLGHPSVTLFPSLLALAEWQEKSGETFLAAYLVGLQAGITVAQCAGIEHYMAGWHGTSTIGHLASAAGCARLLGLDAKQCSHALGIGATQASGLKRVFGTMCKPFHAGRSSEAGLMSAMLAQQGFTSAEDVLEGPHGFFQVLRGNGNVEAAERLGEEWGVQGLSQKYHASCHATHSPLEASLAIVERERVPLNEIESIRVRSSQLALDAAGKSEASTGLEGKFCIPYCVANALVRGQTGTQAFTDERVCDPAVKSLMRKTTVALDPEMKALESRVEIRTTGGSVYSAFSDVLQEIPPLETKRQRVKSKYTDLCEPVMGLEKAAVLAEQILGLEKIKNVRPFAESLLGISGRGAGEGRC
jgi:2-methylcitrate dehydratase PrpD